MALDEKGSIPQDLKLEEWKVQVAGREVVVKNVQSPRVTGAMAQNWVLVFEPILDPSYRISAFQAAAQFLVNLPEGDQVLIVGRTKEGLMPFTPGLTLDRSTWVKALGKLPSLLSNEFNGSPGVLSPSLSEVKPGEPLAMPLNREALFAEFKGFISALPKAIAESPYNQVDPKGVKPLDRLGFDSPNTVRATLSIISAEMKSLELLISALGKLQGPSHCVVFSRNDADTFTHPSVRAAMGQKFTRTRGDDGGPKESAELANRDMKTNQESLRKICLNSGITLHSVAGNGVAYKGNLGSVAEATGGFAFVFDGQMQVRVGQGLQAFASRYRLTWEETMPAAVGFQDLSIKSSKPGLTLMFPSQR
ncbi:MAG TPA: hypothetical protein VJ505_05380 [Holophagaceae bacterium]|nr:hypothetical protein [Holophagaceae bacterium]